MLVQLSIRDIVLIDRLDLMLEDGLSVLTGETGAGKSILLDAFALALGARGDGSLVRHGQPQGQVTAVFQIGPQHPARARRPGHRERLREPGHMQERRRHAGMPSGGCQQARVWPGAQLASGGASRRQRAVAKAQRGWNAQPSGIAPAAGTAPPIAARRWPGAAARGIAASSARV